MNQEEPQNNEPASAGVRRSAPAEACVTVWQVQNRYIRLSLLCLTRQTKGFPWEDLRKILPGCQQIAIVPNGIETMSKISIAWVGCTNITDRQMTDRRTDDDIYRTSLKTKWASLSPNNLFLCESQLALKSIIFTWHFLALALVSGHETRDRDNTRHSTKHPHSRPRLYPWHILNNVTLVHYLRLCRLAEYGLVWSWVRACSWKLQADATCFSATNAFIHLDSLVG